jgi:hypothetical protein
MIVIEYRPNLAILNVYLGFDQLHLLKQSEDFDERLSVHKREPDKLCILRLAATTAANSEDGDSRDKDNDAGGGGEDGGEVKLFSFYWPEELEPYHPCMGQMQVSLVVRRVSDSNLLTIFAGEREDSSH